MSIEKLISVGIKITAINENTHIIPGRNRSRSPFSNSFLITGGANILFDAGCGLDTIEALIRNIRIDMAVLSHSHPDHTAGSWLFNKAGVPVIVPEERADSICNTDRLALRMVESELSKAWISEYLPVTGYRDFDVSGTYSEGHEFDAGDIKLTAMHTPGHTDDHYCMWDPENRVLFGFDIDLSPFGPWYGNPESDIGLFIDSIASIKALPFETYVSSHAKPMNRAHAMKRLEAYESVIGFRDRLILDLMPPGKPATAADITWISPVYGCDYKNEMDRILFYGESNMIRKHLVRLAGMGRLTRENNAFVKKA